MRKTKIDWADSTWNPVTGCLHDCEYCYAKRIAERFKGGGYGIEAGLFIAKYKDDVFKPPYVLEVSQLAKDKSGWYRDAHYPFGFEPTFHRYRLGEPAQWKKPSTIFVCSMADLFGDWVPDEWIEDVLAACDKAPQHRYLFLTKNQKRYDEMSARISRKDCPPVVAEKWLGFTYTGQERLHIPRVMLPRFVSIEPLMAQVEKGDAELIADTMSWVIIGAEIGRRKGKVVPEKSWIDVIVQACREVDTPVFMKESLRDVMGDDFIQEYPWEVRNGT